MGVVPFTYMSEKNNEEEITRCALGHAKIKNRPCRICRINKRLSNGGRINRVNREYLLEQQKENENATRRSN